MKRLLWLVWLTALPLGEAVPVGELVYDVFPRGKERRAVAERTNAADTLDAHDVPIFHSREGSAHVLYLDFAGHVHDNEEAGVGWASFVAAPFSLDADAASLSRAERDFISEVWARVAEDFCPWAVDVTTEAPDAWMAAAGGHVLITRARAVDGTWMPLGDVAGGVAYVGGFGALNRAYQPALVYYDNLGPLAADTAEAVSHELGHLLGLFHHGRFDSVYFAGDRTSWAPIMGVGYGNKVTQWSDGDYVGATNPDQDDMAVIDRFLPRRVDAIGDTMATAGAVTFPSPRAFHAEGAILTRSDVDMWRVAGKNLRITARPYAPGGNLDIKMTVYAADGAVLGVADPADTTEAVLVLDPPPADSGTLFVAIEGAGVPATGTRLGYTDYGSVGQYTLDGTLEETPTEDGGSGFAFAFACVTVAFIALLVVACACRAREDIYVAYVPLSVRYASVLRSA